MDNVKPLPWFTAGDLDGFFGLFIDNIIQLLVISSLCVYMCGIPAGIVIGTILPAAAFSILIGNLFYTWQARRLAQRTGDPCVTALPYGINTVSLFAFVLFIMAPVYQATNDWKLAYSLGLVACFFSGIMESAGAFVAEKIRRWTPRPALLATLASISIGFISMDFILRIYSNPGTALLPLGIVLVHYFSKIKLPFHIPGGLVAIIAGTVLAWMPFEGIGFLKWEGGQTSSMDMIFSLPLLLEILGSVQIWDYISIIVPMGLFNILGSLQNIESAAAVGDEFDTQSSLLANGAGTIVAALLGSCFPTTIYIGHPGWKGMGARQGYSAINGIVIFLLCIFGLMGYVIKIIPIEAGAAIVFWIAIVITAQAFQVNKKEHAPAIVLGLIPGIVAWGLLMVEATLIATGNFNFANLGLDAFANSALAPIKGMLTLERGFLFTCMIWAAAGVYIIDRQLYKAAIWIGIAALFSFVGIIHAYELTPQGTAYNYGFNVNPGITTGYILFALYLLFVGYLHSEEGRTH